MSSIYASSGGPSKCCSTSLWVALTCLSVGLISAAPLSVCAAVSFTGTSSLIGEAGACFSNSSASAV